MFYQLIPGLRFHYLCKFLPGRPIESLQPYVVEQRCSRSCALSSGRQQTHWRDRRSNDKEEITSVRKTSPSAATKPENSSLPHETCVITSETEHSLELISPVKNTATDEKLVAGGCVYESPDEEVDASSHLLVSMGESMELNESQDLGINQVNCTKEDVNAFTGSSLRSLEIVNLQVDRVLRVMIDLLHPDGRSMQGGFEVVFLSHSIGQPVISWVFTRFSRVKCSSSGRAEELLVLQVSLGLPLATFIAFVPTTVVSHLSAWMIWRGIKWMET